MAPDSKHSAPAQMHQMTIIRIIVIDAMGNEIPEALRRVSVRQVKQVRCNAATTINPALGCHEMDEAPHIG
jgi:hypothetical protein